MRVQHFFEHVTESDDPLDVLFCAVGDPVVGPGENSNAPVDPFYSARPTALGDLVGDPSSVFPDYDREQEKRKQYGDSDRY